MQATSDLMTLWQCGVTAVRGDVAVQRALERGQIPRPDRIIAVGKAAGAMARAAADRWPDVPCLVVTKYGHGAEAPAQATVIEAAHPVPDAASLAAGHALVDVVAACPAGSHLLMLVSGGASALAEVPADGRSLEALMQSTNALLASGATIGAMNVHRTARSQIKGGKLLARFKGARVSTLALSDVEGDALATIGSGIGDAPADCAFDFHPLIVASNTIARDAVAAAAAHGSVAAAAAHSSVAAAAAHGSVAAAAAPLPVIANDESLYGDITTLAPDIAVQLLSGAAGLTILGGEPVTVLPDSPGKGGRNMALALLLAREIAGTTGLRILVAGTDGTDGPTDAAGALVDGQTWDDSGADALARADAYPWLDARGALVRTGPTGTNVADLLIAIKN